MRAVTVRPRPLLLTLLPPDDARLARGALKTRIAGRACRAAWAKASGAAVESCGGDDYCLAFVIKDSKSHARAPPPAVAAHQARGPRARTKSRIASTRPGSAGVPSITTAQALAHAAGGCEPHLAARARLPVRARRAVPPAPPRSRPSVPPARPTPALLPPPAAVGIGPARRACCGFTAAASDRVGPTRALARWEGLRGGRPGPGRGPSSPCSAQCSRPRQTTARRLHLRQAAC